MRDFFLKSYPEAAAFLQTSPDAVIHGPGSLVQAAADANNTLAIMNKKKEWCKNIKWKIKVYKVIYTK